MKNLPAGPEFVSIQLCTTTAEEQASYFTGDAAPFAVTSIGSAPVLPKGSFRVVAGALYRIAPGIPLAVEERGA